MQWDSNSVVNATKILRKSFSEFLVLSEHATSFNL
jgi:hypothetical protein